MTMPQTTKGKDIALGALAARRENPPRHIDNASLHAGSPMYFYCIACGWLAETKPESYMTPVRKFCTECQALKDLGWL